MLHIPILGTDINQAGEPPPIIGWEVTLINLYILDGVRNYGTEEAQKVSGDAYLRLRLCEGLRAAVHSGTEDSPNRYNHSLKEPGAIAAVCSGGRLSSG